MSTWIKSFKSRKDLSKIGHGGLILFALELKYGTEDIETVASGSLIDGPGDKKIDFVYVDFGLKSAIIAQEYISQSISKKEAPANKASGLNTAVTWLLNKDTKGAPKNVKDAAAELQKAINDGSISTIHIWYVHNLPISKNVSRELKKVEATTKAHLNSISQKNQISVQALEVGKETLEEWYKSILTPILITGKFTIKVPGLFQVKGKGWEAFTTTVKADFLYGLFKKYGEKLFSANIREYLGSRDTDENINNNIKQTAANDPKSFWVYNNGITVLVNTFFAKGNNKLKFEGISVVNGAQTTGAIGNLLKKPSKDAFVQVRFIKCDNQETIKNIVRFNNSQNKIAAPDFRSNDVIQCRLLSEFKETDLAYISRRGGVEDRIKRPPNPLPSITAGQALAAFHGNPDIAYHKKTQIWEQNSLYDKYFNDNVSAKHILFVYSLLKAIDNTKLNLYKKSKKDSLTEIEERQLDYFRKRGSVLLMMTAVADCLENFVDEKISNKFRSEFLKTNKLNDAIKIWYPIISIATSFTDNLAKGLVNSSINPEDANKAIKEFQSLVYSTKESNKSLFNDFSKKIIIN